MHYILFAPAKTMNLQSPRDFSETPHSNVQGWRDALPEQTRALMQSLSALNKDELQKLFKLSDAKVCELSSYIEAFANGQCHEAISMYEGMAYKALDISTLGEGARAYLAKHLMILSALYGAVRPFDLLKPYRLDFTTPLRMPAGAGNSFITLKALWSDYYASLIPEGALVFNLASKEFASQLDASRYDWVEFDFFELVDVHDADGKKQTKRHHATLAKKGRGKLLRTFAEYKPTTREELRSLPGYGIYFDLI